MNYRTAALLAPEDLGAAGTKTIDIDVTQPISRIDLHWQVTKASEGMSAPGPADITKIEIVDGSRVLWSLSGYECQALNYYNRPGVSFQHGQAISTLSQVNIFSIDFGRWLWDELLAFRPGAFRNPQLKVTWDEDVSDTSVTANQLEVLAHMFDEKVVEPIGFLRAVEEFNYTLGADNSFQNISLSEDLAIRQILVRAYQDGFEPWYSIDEARLDENNLQRIPFEYTNLEDYYRRMKSVWHPVSVPMIVNVNTSARTFYSPGTDYWATAMFLPVAATNELYESTVAARGGKFALIGSGSGQAAGHAFGYLPWHCYQFPMGKAMEIEDWYDPAGRSPRLRLRASTGATSSTGQVVLEQLHRYQ